MNPISPRAIFFIIFAVSGFSGLIYESIWSHYLKLFLGHSAYAQTLVLAIFMGGMAIGALLCSRYSPRWKNLLVGYAVAEALIGISALLFHDAFTAIINYAYQAIFPALGGYMGITAFKWGLAALLILPQSILLGMTFPLMSAGIIRRYPQTPGSSIAMLYFSNSFGGALGVLVSGFILVDLVGLPGTIMLAGIINLLLAGVVWSLCRHDQLAPIEAPKKDKKDALLIPLLTVSLLTGAASFIYEISWIRMLSMVLGSSSHAFELMLSAFIFGLAFGGLWIRRHIDRLADSIRFLAWVQIAMGILAISTLLLYSNTFNLMQWMVNTLEKSDSGYFLFNLGSHAIALIIMLPATFCAGMTLPLITFTLLRRGLGEMSIGAVYSSNTLGAIIGILFAVHIGLPLLGLKDLVIFAAAIDIMLGLYLLAKVSHAKLGNYLRPAVALLLLVVSVILIELDTLKMASGVFRTASLLDAEQASIVDHQDGKTASISLYQTPQQIRLISTNGKPDASIRMDDNQPAAMDENTMLLAAAIPLLMHPEAKTVANIGFGSGLSSQMFLSAQQIDRLDNIEIEKAMIEVAKGFSPYNDLAYSDPRSHIHIEDAKTFFSSHQLKYDIILSEPSNPWVSGVSGLFSDEFYGLVKHHLNENGMLVQWVQLYEIEPELVASIVKSLAKHFPYFEVYAPSHGDIILLASQQDRDFSLKGELFNDPGFSKALSRVDIHSLQDVSLFHVANREMLMPLIEHYPIMGNSDYYPVIDQNAAKTRFLGKSAIELIDMAYFPLPLLDVMGVSAPTTAPSAVSYSGRYPPQFNAFRAQMLRDGLLGERASLPPEALQIIDTNFAMLQQCRAPAHGDRVYELYRLATLTVPQLNSQELATIWQQLINPRCLDSWSRYETDWLTFLQAIGARDSQTFSLLAEQLLNQAQPLTDTRKQYLLAAGMLGFVAQGQPARAAAMWQQHSATLFTEQAPHLFFQLLLAHAQQATT